jgi:putative membrane protein
MAMDNMAATDNMAAPADAAVPATGQEYATMAAASDMYEIEAARLAAEKAQNADVKSLAEMIRADHEKSTADLKTAAGQAQPPITVTAAMNPEQQSMVQALQGASGADFDRTYLDQQVQAHQKALAMVQGYAQNGDVEGLKKHASTVAGPIQQHLQRARELQTSAAR